LNFYATRQEVQDPRVLA